jgi:hypothetical protein
MMLENKNDFVSGGYIESSRSNNFQNIKDNSLT